MEAFEDETDGTMRMQHISLPAGRVLLRIALRMAREERGSSRSPIQVAGGPGGDIIARGNLPGAREGALVGGGATIRECATECASAVRGPARV